MKKLIGIILAVVLLAGGLGTVVYAAVPHVPMTGEKLVGMGRMGTRGDGPTFTFFSVFRFTNPDCVGTITITRISIMKSGGTVVYEGPLLRQEVSGGEVVDDSEWMEPMNPHEGRDIALWTYFPDPDDQDYDWMSKQEAYGQPLRGYSVEIFYETERKGLPLVGDAFTTREFVRSTGDIQQTGYSSQMFNLNQKLR